MAGMTPAHSRTDFACRNCGTPAPLKFCPECGQETTLHPPTLGEFLHEFVGHYVALEGQLWRTLAVLLRRPGRLTREYLEGRRRRYVLPLRLYLTASFLFFLVVKLTAGAAGEGPTVTVDGRHVPLAEYEALAASGAASAPRPHFTIEQPTSCGHPGQPACKGLKRFLADAGARMDAHPEESLEHMRTHFIGYAPYAIFILLPAFSGLMMLAYRKRRLTYGEHFVFSLHLHAFWFLALLVIALVPESVGSVLQLGVPVYGVWAMREAYGGRWLPTIARALLVSVLYGVVLTLASIVLGLTVLATA